MGNELSPLRKTVCGIDRKGDRDQHPTDECEERYIQAGSNIRIDLFHPGKTERHDEQHKEGMFLETKSPWEETQQCDCRQAVDLKLLNQSPGMKTTPKR